MDAATLRSLLVAGAILLIAVIGAWFFRQHAIKDSSSGPTGFAIPYGPESVTYLAAARQRRESRPAEATNAPDQH
jgi:hypothetical protein